MPESINVEVTAGGSGGSSKRQMTYRDFVEWLGETNYTIEDREKLARVAKGFPVGALSYLKKNIDRYL